MNFDPIAFIGLDSMAAPIAHSLLSSGMQLTVFNDNATIPTESLTAAGARVASYVAQAVASGSVVISMLSSDAELEAVTFGPDGIAIALCRDGLHISMSAVSPQTSRKVATEHAHRGSLFLSAPVFGRPEDAAAKKLWIAQSGSAQAKARAKPLLDAIGLGVHDFGEDPGTANVVKLSGDFLILSAVEAIAEALALVGKYDIGRNVFTSFLGQVIFASPILQNCAHIMAERAYVPAGFHLESGMKEVCLLRDLAEHVTLPMPLVDLLHDRLLTSLAKGRQALDLTGIELISAEVEGLH